MNRIAAIFAIPFLPTCADVYPNPAVSPRLDSGITSSNGGGARPGHRDRREHYHARRPGPVKMRAMRKLLVAILLASASGAAAQTPRNGPEWGGKDHQPTEAGVIRREGEAKVRAPPARVEEDNHTVKQLDQELLHDEAVDDPPRNPDRRAPP